MMVVSARSARRASTRKSAGGSPWFPLVFFGSIAYLFLQFYAPPDNFLAGPFGRPAVEYLGVPDARPAPDAYGKSGGVTMRFAMPGENIQFPLEIFGDPTSLMYQWVRMSDMSPVDSLRQLHGAEVRVPGEPGFYKLALARGTEARVLQHVTLAVKVPFAEKTGVTLNGYRIGTYVSELRGARSAERPDGFVEVSFSDLDLTLSRHFTVADFVTHDNQTVWPRYVAVSPQILDKVELVLAQLEKLRGADAKKPGLERLVLDVHSAFRTPIHNRIRSQARESRHQYGDAVDFSIDADGDGRVNSRDLRLLSDAVDSVEKYHPELEGGLGLYSGINYRIPYVHIDARGTKVRWRG
jgi:hypothetical protein